MKVLPVVDSEAAMVVHFLSFRIAPNIIPSKCQRPSLFEVLQVKRMHFWLRKSKQQLEQQNTCFACAEKTAVSFLSVLCNLNSQLILPSTCITVAAEEEVEGSKVVAETSISNEALSPFLLLAISHINRRGSKLSPF